MLLHDYKMIKELLSFEAKDDMFVQFHDNYKSFSISSLISLSYIDRIYPVKSAYVFDVSGPYHGDGPAGQREGGHVHLDCCS